MKKTQLAIGIIIGLIISIGLSGGLIIAKASVHGKFAKQTYVAGIDVSLKTREEALEMIEKATEKFFNQSITIVLGEREKNFLVKDLGVEIFPKETIKTLQTVNAKNLGILKMILPERIKKTNLGVITKVDYHKALDVVSKEFNLKELEPKSAGFFFENGKKLAISQEQSGLILNEQAFIKSLRNNAKQLKSEKIFIETQNASPLISADELLIQKEKIKKILHHSVTLRDPIYTDDWTIKLTDHLDWVQFSLKEPDYFSSQNQQFKEVTIEIKQENLNAFIDENLSKWLDRPPEDVNVSQNENGKITIEGKGNNGLKIQRKLLKQSLELAINNQIKEITIPVIEIQPKLNIPKYLQDLGVKERLAVGHTSYYGSPANRVHNIKVGAAKFNGLLIAPGETFSFNKNLGNVDAKNGFKKELVIKKEGTVPDFGGGVCQVSTTMFRAALFGGLPIVERNQHSYAVSYYSQILGHGLDATIFLGGPDLKFENNTPGHLLIQTYVENDYEIYIVLYGTADGRNVEMEGPYISGQIAAGPTIYEETTQLTQGETKQAEKPHNGFKALWYRHLTDKDGNLKSETISTKYQAIPGKILVGTAKSP